MNQEINRIFDNEIEKLTGGTIDMGIIEVIKRQGRQEGRKEGKHEKAIAIAREMKKRWCFD